MLHLAPPQVPPHSRLTALVLCSIPAWYLTVKWIQIPSSLPLGANESWLTATPAGLYRPRTVICCRPTRSRSQRSFRTSSVGSIGWKRRPRPSLKIPIEHFWRDGAWPRGIPARASWFPKRIEPWSHWRSWKRSHKTGRSMPLSAPLAPPSPCMIMEPRWSGHWHGLANGHALGSNWTILLAVANSRQWMLPTPAITIITSSTLSMRPPTSM